MNLAQHLTSKTAKAVRHQRQIIKIPVIAKVVQFRNRIRTTANRSQHLTSKIVNRSQNLRNMIAKVVQHQHPITKTLVIANPVRFHNQIRKTVNHAQPPTNTKVNRSQNLRNMIAKVVRHQHPITKTLVIANLVRFHNRIRMTANRSQHLTSRIVNRSQLQTS